MITSLRNLLLTLVSVTLVQGLASAQTSLWNTTASGVWSDGTRWSGGVAPTAGGSSTQVITFTPGSITSSFTSTLDSAETVSGSFTLNTLTLSALGAGGQVTIAASGGSFLNFAGTSNVIAFNPSNSQGSYNIAAPIKFVNGLTINMQGGASNANTITGQITGTGSITIDNNTGNNSDGLTLAGNVGNSYGGLVIGSIAGRTSLVVTATGTNVAGGGTTTIGAAGELVASANNVLGAGNIILNGGKLAYNSTAGGGQRILSNTIVVANNSTLLDPNSQGGAALSLTGTVNLSGAHILTISNRAGSLAENVNMSGDVVNGTLVKSGLGLLVLSGTDVYTGANYDVIQGTLQYNTTNALTSSGSIILAGAGSLAATQTGTLTAGAQSGVSGWLTSGKITANSNGAIAFSSSSGASNENIDFTSGGGYNSLMLGATVNTTYTGTITAGANGYNLGGGGATLTLANADALTGSNKVNIGSLGQPIFSTGVLVAGTVSTGTIVLNNANTTSGATSVNAGTLDLSATSTSFGTLANSAVTVNSGALLSIDSVGATSLTGSVVRASSLTLNSGLANVSTVTGTQTTSLSSNDNIAGNITFNSGYSTLTVAVSGISATTGSAELFANAIASNGGGGLVNGNNLGKAAPGTAGDSNIMLSTVPTIVGTGTFGSGGAGTNKNLAIIPYLVGESAGGVGTQTGVANTFLTYDMTTGLRPLDTVNEFATVTGTSGFVTDANNRVTAAVTTGNNSINSLVIAGGNVTITDSTVLTDESGAILFTTTNNIAPSSTTGALAFGANPADIFVNSGLTPTISAAVTGTGGLNKFGAGNLTLSSALNTFTGSFVVSGGGQLTISNANAATTGAINVAVLSGTLTLGNAFSLGNSANGVDTSGSLLVGDTSGSNAANVFFTTSTFARKIVIQSGNDGIATLQENGGTTNNEIGSAIVLGSANGAGHGVTLGLGNLTGFSGLISDPTGLLAGTAGVVTINSTSGQTGYFGNSASTYSGGTIINGPGAMSITISGGTGSFFGTGVLVINAGSFNQQQGITTVNGYSGMILNSDLSISGQAGLIFAGTGAINLGAVGTTAIRNVTATSSASAFTLEIDGAFANGTNGFTNGINFNSNQVLVLKGASTYTGPTSIVGVGGLQVTSINSVVSGTATSNLGAPTTVANGTISFGSTTTSGTLIYTGATTTSDRNINLAGTTGGASIVNNGSGALTLTGSVTATGLGTKKLTLAGSRAGNSIGGAVVDSAGGATGVVQNGSGGWALNGANTYSGGTQIIAGTLTTGNTSALGSGQVALSASTSAKLVLTNDLNVDSLTTVLVAPSITSGGTGYTSPTVSISAPYTGGTQATATANASSGVINAITATNLGSNYATAPIYTVTGGTGSGAVINANYGLSSIALGANTLTLTGTGSSAYGGIISGTGNVVKNGSGTQVFGAASTYTGTTTINTGSLVVVNASGSGTGTGALNVASGGTLGGTGSINNSISTINGTVQAGFSGTATNTTGNLTLVSSGGTTFSGASMNLQFNLSAVTPGTGTEINVGSSAVTFGTGMTLTANLIGSDTNLISPGSNDYILFAGTGTYTGLNVNGSGHITNFSNIVLTGNTFGIANGTQYAGSYLYQNGANIDIVLVSGVPEPGTWALMVGGLALLLVYQRSRRSKNV